MYSPSLPSFVLVMRIAYTTPSIQRNSSVSTWVSVVGRVYSGYSGDQCARVYFTFFFFFLFLIRYGLRLRTHFLGGGDTKFVGQTSTSVDTFGHNTDFTFVASARVLVIWSAASRRVPARRNARMSDNRRVRRDFKNLRIQKKSFTSVSWGSPLFRGGGITN